MTRNGPVIHVTCSACGGHAAAYLIWIVGAAMVMAGASGPGCGGFHVPKQGLPLVRSLASARMPGTDFLGGASSRRTPIAVEIHSLPCSLCRALVPTVS